MFGGAMLDMLIPAAEREALVQQAGTALQRLQAAEMTLTRVEHKCDRIMHALARIADKAGVNLLDDAAMVSDARIVSETQNARPE